MIMQNGYASATGSQNIPSFGSRQGVRREARRIDADAEEPRRQVARDHSHLQRRHDGARRCGGDAPRRNAA